MRAQLIGAVVAVALAACKPAEAPLPTFRVAFDVRNDDGGPLAGALIRSNHGPLGSTGVDGNLTVEMRGKEGSSLEVGATCPAGFEPLTKSLRLTLRSFQSLDPSTGALRMMFECRRLERLAALVVRADGQADLPVLVGGRRVATTNADGVAHLAFHAPMNTPVLVGLDTTGRRDLQPQNPVQAFHVGESDELLIYSQPFDRKLPPKIKPRRKKAPPPPQRPVRVGSPDKTRRR
jgi:hypothetical protein